MSDDDTKYTPTGAPIDERFVNPTPPVEPVEPAKKEEPGGQAEAFNVEFVDDPPKPKTAKARSKHATRKSSRR